MRSMTGYGVGEAPLGEGRLTLEVRALNHRYVDVRVRLPVELSDYAFFTEQKARELLSRGRFDIGVRVDDAALPAPNLSIARARSIYLALQSLRDELAPGTELPVSAVTAIPELIQAPSTMQSEQIQNALVAGLKAAVTLSGRRGGIPRPPLATATEAEVTELKRLMDAARAAL